MAVCARRKTWNANRRRKGRMPLFAADAFEMGFWRPGWIQAQAARAAFQPGKALLDALKGFRRGIPVGRKVLTGVQLRFAIR